MPSTEMNAVDAASSNPSDLYTQLVTGPSTREVANNILRPALEQLYPQLEIDPTLAMIVSPSWQAVAGEIRPGPLRFESLTDALVRHGIWGTSVTYIEGEHFLSLEPTVVAPIHLPVEVDAIGRLINQLAPVLFVAYQEQQIDYWNQTTSNKAPRWQELSEALHQTWNVDKVEGWDTHQLAMARRVFDYPDGALRRSHDTYHTRACLIDMDQLNGAVSTHLNRTDTVVLVGTLGARTIILSHSISTGFQAFDSLDQLGESLPAQAGTLPPDTVLQWRLFEPTGNIFDHQASTLIALQADALVSLNFTGQPAKPDIAPANGAQAPQDEDASRFDKVQRLIPEWLDNASPADLGRYSRHMLDLALVQRDNGGKSFDDNIVPIKQFALDALRTHMLILHPDTANLKLEDIEIVVDSQVVWGTFTAPGLTETTRFGLAELALENLIAVPLGNWSVRNKNGMAVPTWMTPNYLKDAITAVDIGSTYPASVKSKLLDDPVESLRRQRLYANNLRVQLALQALQSKILGEHGIDDQGYRYVAAVMNVLGAERRVDGQDIVIRPLAFIPQPAQRQHARRGDQHVRDRAAANGQGALPALPPLVR